MATVDFMDVSNFKRYDISMMLSPNSVHTLFIETPRGSFVKRNETGEIDFVSPMPSPFHYGHVVGFNGGDGDPLDGLYIGRFNQNPIRAKVIGVVRFVDNDLNDDKWIFSNSPLRRRDLWLIHGFFTGYALCKNLVAKMKGRATLSYMKSIELWTEVS